MKKGYILKRISMKGTAILLSGALALSASGCGSYKSSSANSNIKYDTIDTMNEELAINGIEQTLNIPGEDFKLEVNYRCILENKSKWTVTADKEIYMDINTIGLPDDYQVFIDNVHMDATIRSYFQSVDGITQDSMDDRIHNSQMLGFPVNDKISYSNIFCIEGQNESFIQGSIHGFNGLVSGTIEERRFRESDYLSKGVYANKISSVIDLIIVYSDGSMRCVAVPSNIQVTVWPFVRYVSSDEDEEDIYRYYYYDNKKGEVFYKNITESEYLELTGSKSDQLKLKID